ncbi:MAG: hypothetical protein ABIK86_07510, partial [candidate division WOR-3 bacterium]
GVARGVAGLLAGREEDTVVVRYEDPPRPAPGNYITAPEPPGCVNTGRAPAIGRSARYPDRYYVGTEAQVTRLEPGRQTVCGWEPALEEYRRLAQPWFERLARAREDVARAKARLNADPTDVEAALVLGDN